jgi:hypothetical protein
MLLEIQSDCWSFVAAARLEQGLPMPDYAAWLHRRQGRFVRLPAPRPGAVVALRSESVFVDHIGIVLPDCRAFSHRFMTGVRTEPMENWSGSIEGLYEYDPAISIPIPPAATTPDGCLLIRVSLNSLTDEVWTLPVAADGRTIAELLSQIVGDADVIVMMNDGWIDPDDWDGCIPQAGDVVAIRAYIGDARSRQMMGMIGMFALALAAPHLVGIKGAGAMFTVGSKFTASLFQVAIVAGGGLLLNKLLASSVKENVRPSYYEWNPRTTQQTGGVIPTVYGLHNCVHGNIIASYCEVTNTTDAPDGWWEQLMFMNTSRIRQSLVRRNVLLCLGAGPVPADAVTEENLEINGRPVSDISGLSWEFLPGTMDQSAASKFGQMVCEYYSGQKVDYGTPLTFTVKDTGYSRLLINLYFPDGLFHTNNEDGSIMPEGPWVKVEVAEYGTEDWTTLYDWWVRGLCMTPVRKVLDTDSTWPDIGPITIDPAKRYTIKVTRGTAQGNPRFYGDEMRLGEVQGFIDIAFTHPGKVLLQLSGVPSEQLQGQSLDVTVKNMKGKIVQYYSGGSWLFGATSTPAWAAWSALTQPVIVGDGDGTPYSVGLYRGLQPSQLLPAGFVDAESLSTGQVPDGEGGYENRIEFDGVFDSTQTVYDAVQRIGSTGRFGIDCRGNQVGLWVEKARTPCGVLCDGNWKRGSWQADPVESEDMACELEMNYEDKDRDYQRITVPVPDFEVNGAGRISLDLMGTKRFSEAWRTGKYSLAKNRLGDSGGSCLCDVPAIVYEAGDVVYVQQPGKSWGGMVSSASGRIVVIDDDVTVSASDYLIVQVIDPASGTQKLEVHAVASVSGRRVTIAEDWTYTPPTEADPWLFGPASILEDTYEIIDLKPQPHLYWQVIVQKYAVALFTTDDSDPDMILGPTPVSPVDRTAAVRPITWNQIERHYLASVVTDNPVRKGVTVGGLDYTANVPAKTVEWVAGTITHLGVVWPIEAGGPTTHKYVWFDSTIADPTILQSSDTMPSTAGQFMIFINREGVVSPMYGTPVGDVANAVYLDEIIDGAVYKKMTAAERTKLLGIEEGADVTGDHVADIPFDDLPDGALYKKMLAAERTKLGGIEEGADVTRDHLDEVCCWNDEVLSYENELVTSA